MSRILVDQIRSNSAASDALTLDGSGNLTIPGNLTCSGNTTLSGDASLSGTGTGFGIGGKILQVVSTTKSDTFSTSSGSFTDVTGLNATITPANASNKVLVLVHVSGNCDQNSRVNMRLLRASTTIGMGDAYGNRCRTFGGIYAPNNADTTETVSCVHLDSPNTTSATTYKIQISFLSPATIYINRSNSWTDNITHNTGTSSITLLEVAA